MIKYYYVIMKLNLFSTYNNKMGNDNLILCVLNSKLKYFEEFIFKI